MKKYNNSKNHKDLQDKLKINNNGSKIMNKVQQKNITTDKTL